MESGDKITNATILDRGIYEWMHDLPDACLWGIIQLDAPLNDERILKTLEIMIEYAPICSAKLKKGIWLGRWEFVKPGHVASLITRKKAKDKDDADQLLKEVIQNPAQFENPPAFRVTSIDSPGTHYLALQVHHIIADGEGAKKLFEFFAKIYRELEKDPNWLPDYQTDMNRSWIQFFKFLQWYHFLLAPIINLKESINLIFFLLRLKKSATIIDGDNHVKPSGKQTTDPQFETFQITGNKFLQLKNSSFMPDAKLNDLIMAALMTTVYNWNSSRGKTCEYVYTGFTANLRLWWGWPKGIIANMSVIRIMWAKSKDLQNVHSALKTLKPKFDSAKKEFGIKELWDLLTFSICPELISRMFVFLIMKVVKNSHALTNIGKIPDHAGNFGAVQAISYSLLAPPLAAPSIVFTASGYKDSLTIHCNFNTIHMKPKTAKQLMQHFQENLLLLRRKQ